jgi:hypothetical protein
MLSRSVRLRDAPVTRAVGTHRKSRETLAARNFGFVQNESRSNALTHLNSGAYLYALGRILLPGDGDRPAQRGRISNCGKEIVEAVAVGRPRRFCQVLRLVTAGSSRKCEWRICSLVCACLFAFTESSVAQCGPGIAESCQELAQVGAGASAACTGAGPARHATKQALDCATLCSSGGALSRGKPNPRSKGAAAPTLFIERSRKIRAGLTGQFRFERQQEFL